ncbi:MAG: homocysteine S-methyltransferase family protein, partial [Syntrophomonadaceae bacterium]|nr:homocysteine S-methyltransferase family protein [Syntrophomonadaceae bacterium]
MEAGARILQTNTFGANRFKLAEYGLQERVAEINAGAVRAARKAAAGRAWVALDVGPTGKLLEPAGDVTFDELYHVFRAQIEAGVAAGADAISIETMSDIGELRAAVIAARDCCDLPILAHLTFAAGGRTVMGTDAVTAAIILEALGVTAMGANCSGGARELLPVIEAMARVTPAFLSVQPNAGMPRLVDGATVFPESPEDMAAHALRLREAGANIIGGCCGTTPEHIRAIASALDGLPPVAREVTSRRALASRGRHVFIDAEAYPVFIGERINPTARKKLAADIAAGKMAVLADEARGQVEAGAEVLDVNVGVPAIDEAAAMRHAVLSVQAAVDVPLSIDSSSPDALEAGLKAFVGRALINSTTGDPEMLERVLPLARRYGAAVLGLCLDETGIPPTAEGRLQVATRIHTAARAAGLRDQDIFIDCLVKTASAEQEQVMETLRALRLVKQVLGVGTVLGVSNVSHGLPRRDLLNSTYLAMAYAHGLDVPIMNPFDERMQEVRRAAAVLLARDPYSRRYLGAYGERPETSSLSAGKEGAESPVPPKLLEVIREAVVNGDRERMPDLVAAALAAGLDAMEVMNRALLPGIERVGELYEQQRYFLPQLMLSAETMKEGFARLKPLLVSRQAEGAGTVVLATVQGDIHDIGKNIVALLLENYGFEIVDLGKDVPAADIVEAAARHRADIVGLSALMTTTMPRMAEVIAGLPGRARAARQSLPP